jgi:tRNA A37 threonylcarbamoyladenosine dehydratase
MNTCFHRTELLLGKDSMQKLKHAHVGVFGLGGVGSYAVEALVRSGVGRITIVDFDTVGLTNLNRQNIAFLNTIGRPKTEVMAERIALISSECKIDAQQIYFCDENSDNLLASDFTAVIDAIDSFNPKIRLLVDCLERKIDVFSAMGAAGKLDPGSVRVGDISESTICPLARKVRKRLRSFGIKSGFQVVYSIEPPAMPFSYTLIEEDKREFGNDRSRERMIQGSISYLPAIFGLTLSGLVISKISGYKTATQTPFGKRGKEDS